MINNFTETFLPVSSESGNYITPDSLGSTAYFASIDTEVAFKKNLQVQPADWHYRTKKVSYNLNSIGYRAPEWDAIDWANSVVIFGCSVTFGVGLAEDETISYQLSKRLNRPVINLGVATTSPAFAFHNSILLHDNLPTPWAVVQNWSGPTRISRYTNTGTIKSFGPWSAGKDKLYDEWIRHETNINMQNYFIIKAAAALWQSKTRYCAISNWEYPMPVERCHHSDFARDMIHPGQLSSITTAVRIATILTAQQSNGEY